jgi:hypothetical protein
MPSPLQNQTKKYKQEYKPGAKHANVHINVDAELADIIRELKKDQITDRAIRGYARAFLGWD